MTLPATIEELATLLAEEERVEVRIREAQASLSTLKKKISESLVPRHVAIKEEEAWMPEKLMREEQSYEHLSKALFEIKNQIAKEIRAVEQRVVRAYADELKQTFLDKRVMLSECLAAIDKKILGCRLDSEQFDRIRSNLSTVHEMLSRLGEESLPIPDPLPTMDLGDLFAGRIDHLRSRGQL
ncbi:MAG: hypothetical protein ACE5JU_09165 [Candidatus Binatia bacterium]